jgi:hypothetical protein
MFHPVGSLPPATYWRRRFVLLGALVVLVVLTAWVLRPGSGKQHSAGGSGHPRTSTPVADDTSSTGSTAPASTRATTSPKSTKSAATKSAAVKSPTPSACDARRLKIAAIVGKPSYPVGATPTLLLQVTNVGTVPCVQNLADSQVELRVYNGESRVWGSHDCEVQPGTDDRTLAVSQAVRVSIVWSGLSSQPSCAGTRQRVGAGTYTLYALLSGHQGAAAQFSIS